MRYNKLLIVAIAALGLASCGGKKSGEALISREDSLKVVSDRAYQTRLSELRKVRENLEGPVAGGDGTVSKGDKFKTHLLDDPTTVITTNFEKLKSKLERSQKDSTSPYGALLTRFRLLNSQHKYMTATYTADARLLRYTSEITFDDKHEEDRDFYFDSAHLVYFREHRTFTQEEQDLMTDDSYFLVGNKVVYSYRDEGSAQASKDRVNIMQLKRFLISGDVNAHVAKEFEDFKKDYEILLNQPLEPLLYPGAPGPQ